MERDSAISIAGLLLNHELTFRNELDGITQKRTPQLEDLKASNK